MRNDPFNARAALDTSQGDFTYYRLGALEDAGYSDLNKLPYTVRILLESAMRQINGRDITEQDVHNLAQWQPKSSDRKAIPFKPGRVVMQDFTGVPAVVDLAAMRSAVKRLGGDPKSINPEIPVDLVIDHSVQVDHFGSNDAFKLNAEIEFQRNRERYEFLHWGQKAFDNFRVVPPAAGIVHQVNLEFLAKGVLTKVVDGIKEVFPDTVVGTDSHTTMINGLGVLGWGVGGIEAEAAMLGQSIDMLAPDVVGFRLFGKLNEGVTPTDLTLTIVQMLREHGVVGKFVEFFGDGLANISLADRAMIANMSPENGATVTFFPVDDETLNYLRLSGRTAEEVELVEKYYKAQGLFHQVGSEQPQFTSKLELDLNTVQPSLAGPKLPHHRVPLNDMKMEFKKDLAKDKDLGGFGLSDGELNNEAEVKIGGAPETLKHGSLVIAAITSCTNTSNPFVMISAGLLAKKAVEKGLSVSKRIKTSLAPGSRVVTSYLEAAGLIEPLAKLGFNLVGYGCTTCIGNSGPIADEHVKGIVENDLVAASVLSGNRNFEGRIHPYSLANYLASPPLVVAYALAGTVDIDLANKPLGMSADGQEVYLKDVWPSSDEVQNLILKTVKPEIFQKQYNDVFDSNLAWNKISAGEGVVYDWDDSSTYIKEPPFFMGLSSNLNPIKDIHSASVLALLGDSITTDHISPAGAIPADGPAGKYLLEHDISNKDFNSFGSRRGNDQVMTRGTFANIRLKNLLVPGVEGGYTVHHPTGEQMSIFDAANRYNEEGRDLIVLAGKMYGTGSSRDWAAKGTLLLGVKAVIAESYERIHRSNLVGMGVLPLQFKDGESAESLGLDGTESFDIVGLSDKIAPQSELTVTALGQDGKEFKFKVDSRLDTDVDVEYYRNGGILNMVIREKLG